MELRAMSETEDRFGHSTGRRRATRTTSRASAARTRGAAAKRRPQRDRGAETRAQLIEAALDVFGGQGFEGASTRQIARSANANLAAIVYHFGGKEGLHIAVAEHVATSIVAKLGPTLASVADPATTSTPHAAHAALTRLISAFADVMLGSEQAERWARFIVREQMQPTAAFDVIYRFLGGAVTIASRLVATILAKPEDEEMSLRVFTLMGQVLVFRVAQTLVLRRMGWRKIGERERTQIKQIVLANIGAILTAGGS
jgi:AcrR family transcriptional regulator